MIHLPLDFRDLLTFLNDERVEYLVVGGYAVNHYAEPRTTGDIDIWLGNAPANEEALQRALRRFGFSESALQQPVFTKTSDILRFGAPPFRVELFLMIAGVDFNDCYPRRTIVDAGKLAIPLIALADLRTNKQAAGRPKDLADLEGLPLP